MGEIHRLRIKSSYKLMKVVDIRIENKPNEHGYLYLKCIIDDSINFEDAINASAEDQIIVYEELENEDNNKDDDGKIVDINEANERNSKRLFNGIVQNIRTTNINGIYYSEIQALTSSIKLDIKKKSRSFQNVNMTYNDLINNMLSYYPGYGFSQYAGKEQKIGKPLFQYQETDWSFLKRIASEINAELYCDVINLNFMFNFGIPSDFSYKLKNNIDYDVFKDLKSFQEAGGYNAGYSDTDYLYYEVKIRDALELGSEIYYKQKILYIREYEAYKYKEEIFYKYKLAKERAVWQSIIYNKLLKGATLEGEVIAVQNEQVKLHLNIDESQDEKSAYWFNYAPPSVNIMYSMPLVGESARLYFPKESSEDPIVTGCIRKNGDTCDGAADTTNRYLHTEYGSEIAMLPGALNIKSGSDALSISFEDETGVTLTSPSGLSLDAGGEVVISTPGSINISAQSQILMTKGNTSNVSLEGEVNVLGGATVSNGSDRTGFPKFTDDEPKQVQIVVKPNTLEGKLITKESADLLKDANGNDISFLDACAAVNALNGNTPMCGTVMTNGESNSQTNNSNSSSSDWNQFDASAFLSPGNIAGTVASEAQTIGIVGADQLPKKILQEPRPNNIGAGTWRKTITKEASETEAQFGSLTQIGTKAGYAGIGVDLYFSYKDDIASGASTEHAVSNGAVNLAFDVGGLWASTEAGAAAGTLAGPVYGTVVGGVVGFFVGLVYIGATQAWKPIKKESGDGYESIQDAAKDAVYNNGEVKKNEDRAEPFWK